jgi:hypothetical protein
MIMDTVTVAKIMDTAMEAVKITDTVTVVRIMDIAMVVKITVTHTVHQRLTDKTLHKQTLHLNKTLLCRTHHLNKTLHKTALLSKTHRRTQHLNKTLHKTALLTHHPQGEIMPLQTQTHHPT